MRDEDRAYVVLLILSGMPELLRNAWAVSLAHRCREMLKGGEWEKPLARGECIVDTPKGRYNFGDLDAVGLPEKVNAMFQTWDEVIGETLAKAGL